MNNSYLTLFRAFLDEVPLEKSSCDFFLFTEDGWSMVGET